MIPAVGMLLETTRAHLVFSVNGDIGYLEAGDLVLIVRAMDSTQAIVLSMNDKRFVYITTLETFENPPTYVDALRMTVYTHVVNEDNDVVVIPKDALLMTLGACNFVFMETQHVFRVDELDARIIEFDAEILSGC